MRHQVDTMTPRKFKLQSGTFAAGDIYLGDHFTRSWTRDNRTASKESPDSPDMQAPESRSQSHQSVYQPKHQQAPVAKTRGSIRDSRGNRKNWASKTVLQSISTDQIQEWKSSFDKLLQSPIGSRMFKLFLTNEVADENILFWEAVEELKQLKSDKRMQKHAKNIFDNFISVYSPKEINIEYKMRMDIVERLGSSDFLDPNVYIDAQNQIYGLMHRDSYPRFIASALAAKERLESVKKRCKEDKSSPRTKSRVLCCYGSDPDNDRTSATESGSNANDELRVKETTPVSHEITVQPPGVVAATELSGERRNNNADETMDHHCDANHEVIDVRNIPGSPKKGALSAEVDVLKDPEPNSTVSGESVAREYSNECDCQAD